MIKNTDVEELKTAINRLSAEYDAASTSMPRVPSSLQQNNIKDYTNQHFITNKGMNFSDYANAQLRQSKALIQLTATRSELAKRTVINQVSDAIENNVSEKKSLSRSAMYFSNFRDVDTARMQRQSNKLNETLVPSVMKVIDNFETQDDIVHTYKYSYREHETYHQPSKLKHEPEDLAQTLDYIQGFPLNATMGDLVRTKSYPNNHVVSYVAEKGQENKVRPLHMTVGAVEKKVLLDAKDAGLIVDVKSSKTVKEASQNISKTKFALDAQKRRQADDLKYKRTLLKVAAEVSMMNDDTKVKNVPSMSQDLAIISKKAQSNALSATPKVLRQKVAPLTVKQVKSYLHKEADNHGVTSEMTKLEKQMQNKQTSITAKMKPKPKKAQSSKVADGGRKFGESRPGANDAHQR